MVTLPPWRDPVVYLNISAVNRGVWFQGTVYQYNSVTPAILAARGLGLSNAANLTLLNSQISSTSVRAAGFSLPFSNFPPSTTLTNALRPFPQYGNINPNSSIGTPGMTHSR